MVQAQHKLDKVVKTYEDNYKALKEKGVTLQGSLAVVTPSSAKLDNKSRSDLISSITNDKPTITSTSLWTLKDNIHKINQITKEIDKETSDTNARINMIKTELKKQEIKDARKKLTDKIDKATRLYKESEGKVEDDKTREDLKKWIDDSNTLLSKKDANVDLAVYSSNLGKADDLMNKVKSSRAAYDQLAASMGRPRFLVMMADRASLMTISMDGPSLLMEIRRSISLRSISLSLRWGYRPRVMAMIMLWLSLATRRTWEIKRTPARAPSIGVAW